MSDDKLRALQSLIAKAESKADQPPRVVGLLGRLLTLTDPERLGWEWADDLAADRAVWLAELRREASEILEAWRLREDVDELRQSLGLKSARGRRRTVRKMTREFEIALEYVTRQRSGDRSAFRRVVTRFSCSERTVDRAIAEWGEVCEELLDSVKGDEAR